MTKEPWVISIPDLKGRYALFPMLDGWTDVFAGSGQAHDGHRRAEVRDHRSRLVRARCLQE